MFKTCSIRQAPTAPQYICLSQSAPHYLTVCETTRCIWLPPHDEAQKLLEKFIRIAHHLPYVTLLTSLPHILDQIYAGWMQKYIILPGPAILLLSIFAAATHFWTQSDCQGNLIPDLPEANNQASFWTGAAEDVLNSACRSQKVSIEGVQGSILIAFIRAHMDGLRPYRRLFATSVMLARDLGLHRIDHLSNVSTVNTAQAEIGRRVWWYLCSSDWYDKKNLEANPNANASFRAMAARSGGMFEGIYSCQPRQMITNKPLNVNDEKVLDGMARDGIPLALPTTMSYTMQRIRLAEVLRGIVDRGPLAMAQNSGLSHDAVLNIDTELQALINEVPTFFSASELMLVDNYGLSRTEAQVIGFQGKVLYFLLHSQRCKLHIPYLARVSEDPAYYISREICIKSARFVIESELWHQTSGLETELRFKFSDLLTGAFSACLVLLMDLSINPPSSQFDQQREGVNKSFQLIETVKNESSSTTKLVDSLVHILRKYNASPLSPVLECEEGQPAMGGGSEQQTQAISSREMIDDVSDVPEYRDVTGAVFADNSHSLLDASDNFDLFMAIEREQDDLSSYWLNLTQDFGQGVDLGTFDWEGIFSELDSSFM